jgi:uncharacterized membrane protein
VSEQAQRPKAARDMAAFLKAWAITAIVVFPIDFVWLKSMRWFYEREMGDLLLAQPRLMAAVLFYVVFAAAIAFFCVVPNLGRASLGEVLFAGAFLGFAAYGTYDATNYATLMGYPLSITIVDWLWGTVLTAVSAVAAWLVLSRLSAN